MGTGGNGGGNSASLGEGSNVGTVGQGRCSIAWLLAVTFTETGCSARHQPREGLPRQGVGCEVFLGSPRRHAELTVLVMSREGGLGCRQKCKWAGDLHICVNQDLTLGEI